MTHPIRTSDTDIRSGVPLTNSLTHSRTDGESWLSHRDIPGSVTRARTYGDFPIAQVLDEAIDALEMAQTRMGSPRNPAEREPIHPWLRRSIYWRDGNHCGWCYRGWDHGMLVLDHITPWSAGGSDRSDNLRTLCEPCNEGRSNYATDTYKRVMPIGLCDRCYTRPKWNEEVGIVVAELDPESTFRLPIFCGRCGNVDACTDEGRVL